MLTYVYDRRITTYAHLFVDRDFLRPRARRRCMTLTELLPSSIRRRFAPAPTMPVDVESTGPSSDVPSATNEAQTPARKVLHPDIAAFEAALTRGQALRSSALFGRPRYI
jgi:hypothetical protein